MSPVLKGTKRLILIGAVLAISLLLASNYVGSNQVAATDQCGVDGRGSCPNTACNSACGSDGTHHKKGTRAVFTPFYPPECEVGPGCYTTSCN